MWLEDDKELKRLAMEEEAEEFEEDLADQLFQIKETEKKQINKEAEEAKEQYERMMFMYTGNYIIGLGSNRNIQSSDIPEKAVQLAKKTIELLQKELS